MSVLTSFRKLLLFACVVAAGLWWWLHGSGTGASAESSAVGNLPPPFAVVGDSDSHSYQDRLSFPADSSLRGGAYRDGTLQWTEVLARLRGRQLDPGGWGIHGNHELVARAYELAGQDARAPRKQDYRYNFAASGARCENLMESGTRQVPRLVRLMNEESQRWRQGVVVIRIGVNSFGAAESLERLAQDPADREVQRAIAGCVQAVRASVEAIHQRHPDTRVVLVGVFDNSHWAQYQHRWQSPRQLANIDRGLDVFDDALRQLAHADPQLAFFDDRAWFAARWGGRDAAGRPAYLPVEVDGFKVENSAGDSPDHATLEDGHAGLVWNALWAQSMVELVNAEFGMSVTPIGEQEISMLVMTARAAPVQVPAPAASGK